MRFTTSDLATVLNARGIRSSAQRLAIAQYILCTGEHPSADKVWAKVKEAFPSVSRASVYNTLNLFVAKGLIRRLVLSGGGVVFDANVADHHHFIDQHSGRIHDVPREAVGVSGIDNLKDFDVREYHVVMRGRRRPSRRKAP